jgi:hypothetical protein
MQNPFGPSHSSHREVEKGLIRRSNDERDAAATFAALKAQVEAIEETPGTGVAVGVCMPFSNEVLYVQQLGYEGRNVIFMVVERAGTKVRLVQHHTQLQVMLVPVSEGEKRAKVLYMVPKPGAEDSPPAEE